MNFVAIDFETANGDRASACSIGIVTVKDGLIIDRNSWLIRPPTLDFDTYNTYIHGITARDVKNKPRFNELWPEIKKYFIDNIIIAHNAIFDMSVLRHVYDEYSIEYPKLPYSCSRIISQKQWPGLLSYSLATVTRKLNIVFNHHNAEEDAYACALIALRACHESESLSIDELASKLGFFNGELFPCGWKPASGSISKKYSTSIRDLTPTTNDFNSSHPVYNRGFVFTGTLKSMIRAMAMQRVIDLGGKCFETVNHQTNYLVMGDQDFSKFADGLKSNKLKKAEELLKSGQQIEVISEDDFLRLSVL